MYGIGFLLKHRRIYWHKDLRPRAQERGRRPRRGGHAKCVGVSPSIFMRMQLQKQPRRIRCQIPRSTDWALSGLPPQYIHFECGRFRIRKVQHNSFYFQSETRRARTSRLIGRRYSCEWEQLCISLHCCTRTVPSHDTLFLLPITPSS